MGDRAHVVIVENRHVDLRDDHWAAEGFTYDLLLDGLEATLDRARRMTASDPADPASWLDDVWCEAAVVLDLDARHLTWFAWGGMRPRVFRTLLERTWPGWTVVWSPEGMGGIHAIVGLRGAAAPPPDGSLDPEDTDTYLRPWEETLPDGRRIVDSPTVLTVRFEDDTLWSTTVGASVETVGELPWQRVVDHVRAARAAGRAGPGPGGAWAVGTVDSLEGSPTSGVLADLPARRVSWWSHEAVARPTAWFRLGWPGFDVDSWGDRYEAHERATGFTGMQPPLPVVLRSERAELVRLAESPQVSNAAQDLVRYLAENGEQATVAPAAARWVPAARTAARERVLGAVDELLAEGPESLPPAAWIDADGRPGR